MCGVTEVRDRLGRRWEEGTMGSGGGGGGENGMARTAGGTGGAGMDGHVGGRVQRGVSEFKTFVHPTLPRLLAVCTHTCLTPLFTGPLTSPARGGTGKLFPGWYEY